MQGILFRYQSEIVCALLILPILVVSVPLIYATIKQKIRRSGISENEDTVIKRDSISRTLMKVSLALVVAVFLQRLMVLWYGNDSAFPYCGVTDHPFEKIAEAFVYALKALGIDEGYSHFVGDGVAVVSKLFGESSKLVSVYRFMLSLLIVATPVAGGAVIFEVLTTVFPRVRLYFSHFSKKTVYIFSELNERSLALAKSLCVDKAKAIIVFTDTYLDDGKEKTSEMILQAKNFGAICINEDITHINLRFRGKKKLFLIDEEELSNIRSLAAIADDGELAGFRNMQIYVFCQDDSYNLLEQNITKAINDRLEEKFSYRQSEDSADENIAEDRKCKKKKGYIGKEFEKVRIKHQKKRFENHQPVIVRMRDYENIVFNLLNKAPLFEPLTDCCFEKSEDKSVKYKNGETRKKKEFNITVFGTGKIGTQMILSSTWCGQFYGYNLNINVVSKESRESFMRRMDKISPEILESTRPGSPILRIYKDVDKHICADPYFRMRYLECDIDNEIIENMVCTEITAKGEDKGAFNIINSDYFVVALGSDETNIAMAEELKRTLSVRGLKKSAKAVIALSVFDHNLCKAFRRRNKEKSDITVCAFGSLDETYEYKAITKIKVDPRDIADEDSKRKKKADEYRDRDKNQYNYKSDLARSIHLKYRMFSAYMFLKENCAPDCEDWDISRGFSSEKAYDGYYEKILKANIESLTEKGPAGDNDIYRYLSWLEHRRWNAYTRSIGFVRRRDGVREKNEKLRIHNCLAECEDYSLPGTGKEKDMLDWALGIDIKTKEEILEKTDYKEKKGKERLATVMAQREEAFDKKYYDEPYIADASLIKWYSGQKYYDNKGEMILYKPDPLNLENVQLPESLEALMEKIAKNVHENWAQLRVSEGWTYGKKRDSDKKTTPCLVAYEDLPEEEKEYDRKTAEQTLKTIIALGYSITKE